MRDFSKRRGSKEDVSRFLITVAGVIILFFLTFVAVRAGWSMYGKFSEAAQSNGETQANLADLKAQQAQVAASVKELQSERGVEAQVRQTYGVAKPGEGEIQIVRDSTSSNPVTPSHSNFFGQIWQALLGWL